MIKKLAGYVYKSVARHRMRSALTVAGVASAMFLFCFIEGLQNGVREATENSATRNMLIVYQNNRFCPAASNLPERYESAIRKIPGVTKVTPIKIYVNNCRASLDSVTFRGIPPDRIVNGEKPVQIASGSLDDFAKTSDGAIVGERLASRRNLKTGDHFQIGGVRVAVEGTFKSDISGEDNVAYAHLDFLQRANGVKLRGFVTEFEVTVADASKADETCRAIDDLFRADTVPTMTKSHRAFVASATGDILGLIRFTRWLGLLCVAVVLALTANTVYVMVQDRVREHAVLQTLGFTAAHLFFIVIAESLLLSLSGGILGTGAAAGLLKFGHFGLGAEGVNISFLVSPFIIAAGLVVSAITGTGAGLLPAIEAAFAPIVESLRKT